MCNLLCFVHHTLEVTASCFAEWCRYTGTWECICRITREEGLGGFFKGMESKILQTALNAVSMMPADVPGLNWGGGGG